MITDDEFKSAGYRNMTDIVVDQFALRFAKFMEGVNWEVLKELQDNQTSADGLKLLPSNRPSISLKSYSVSLAINADGDLLPDMRTLSLNYVWHIDGEKIEFYVAIMNMKVSIVGFDDEKYVEALLEHDNQLKIKFARAVKPMFDKVN
jgi:hypothetical protein